MKTRLPQSSFNDNWIPYYSIIFFCLFALLEIACVHYPDELKNTIRNILGVVSLSIFGYFLYKTSFSEKKEILITLFIALLTLTMLFSFL